MAGRAAGFEGGAVPNFRRAFVPGASYFFTVVTAERAAILTGEVARSCLRQAMHRARARRPFRTVALVLIPDHLHAIWTLPPGDSAYSRRWAWIKGLVRTKLFRILCPAHQEAQEIRRCGPTRR
jgi:REP element-mobilizing transposase RayT